MSHPLIISDEAGEEIDEIYNHYEHRKIGLGEQFLTALERQLTRIKENPELYAVLYKRTRCGFLRRFPYVVYYRIDVDSIVVIAVQHGHQNPRDWRRRA